MTFEEAKKQYLQYMGSLGRNSGTLYNIHLLLERLFSFCKKKYRLKDLCEIGESHIYHYQKWWMLEHKKPNGEPYAISNVRSELCRLCSFFQWHLKNGNLLSDPTEALELPRRQHPEIGSVLTHQEMEQLLNSPDCSNVVELRDKAVMELMYSSALRIGELCALRPHDLDMKNRTVWIGKGKAGSNRLVPMGKRAVHWVERYLRDSRPWLSKGIYAKPSNHPPRDLGRLFLSIFGCPLSEDGFGTRLRIFLKRAGIHRVKGETHLFRRTCATHLHEAGMDARMIQALLGHKNLEMTIYYTQINILKLQKVHETFHPDTLQEVTCE